jgi:hypothetical protein
MAMNSESVRATAPASYERKAEGSPSSLEPALMKTCYLPCQSVGRLPNRQHPHAGAVSSKRLVISSISLGISNLANRGTLR